MIICSVFLGLLFLVITFYCFKNIWDPHKSYALFIFGLFLAINGIGIAVPVTVTNSLTDYTIETWWLVQCGLAYMPIALAAVWVIVRKRSYSDEVSDNSVILRPEYFWILALVNLFFIILTSRFMLQDGFDKIGIVFNIDSNETLYEERYSYDQEQGHGWFTSFLIYRYLGLITSGLILIYAKQFPIWIRYAATVPLLFITLMRSATELQRGPVVTHFLLVLALIALPLIMKRRGNIPTKKRAGINGNTKIMILAILSIAVGLGLGIFQITHEEESALISFPRRIFVIPAHTAGLYFGLFPNPLSFRGIVGTFDMPLGNWTNWQRDGFNLKQIGYAANGYPHHPNSNLIASSYSADGWISVALISVVFTGMILWFNRAFARVDSTFPGFAAIVTFHGTYAVIQVDFAAALTYGFVISQLLLVGASIFCLKFDRSLRLGV